MTARFPYPNIPRRSYGSTSPYIVVRQPFTGECRREAVETLGLAMNAWIRPDITVLAQGPGEGGGMQERRYPVLAGSEIGRAHV